LGRNIIPVVVVVQAAPANPRLVYTGTAYIVARNEVVEVQQQRLNGGK
jgi:hypothetical protein